MKTTINTIMRAIMFVMIFVLVLFTIEFVLAPRGICTDRFSDLYGNVIWEKSYCITDLRNTMYGSCLSALKNIGLHTPQWALLG